MNYFITYFSTLFIVISLGTISPCFAMEGLSLPGNLLEVQRVLFHTQNTLSAYSPTQAWNEELHQLRSLTINDNTSTNVLYRAVREAARLTDPKKIGLANLIISSILRRLQAHQFKLNGILTTGQTSLLHPATLKNMYNVELVKILLNAGLNVNYRHNRGFTTLMTAIDSEPNPAVIKLLIDFGARVGMAERQRLETALQEARRHGITDDLRGRLVQMRYLIICYQPSQQLEVTASQDSMRIENFLNPATPQEGNVDAHQEDEVEEIDTDEEPEVTPLRNSTSIAQHRESPSAFIYTQNKHFTH